MNSIDKLTEIFSKFPGIGPRQAKRFVYYILSRNTNFVPDLMRAIENLKREIIQCQSCQRFFPSTNSAPATQAICQICSDPTRDNSMLMVVPRDIDYEALEKSGSYRGRYFILGGAIPILEKEPENKVRLTALANRIEDDKEVKEIILAMNANGEGENTADFIREYFKDSGLIFSTLGRGLSTGAELEYADPDTLKNAFLHRTK